MRNAAIAIFATAFLAAGGVFAADIKLPPPETKGGAPLMEALKKRATDRAFDSKALAPQTLSNLLWAAAGVNRPESGRLTAPTAKNWQEIDIYVCTADGVYVYDAKANNLRQVSDKDKRAACGKQAFAKDAPVALVYVADFDKMTGADQQSKDFYSATDTGFISQNVYLFCASENLATVVLGYVDKELLSKELGLKPSQRVILSQPVGHKKK